MKTIIFTLLAITTFGLSAQETEEVSIDTTKFKIGTTEFIIINHGNGNSDTLLVDEDNENSNDEKGKKYDGDSFGHWSGLEFGMNTLLNSKGGSTFNSKFLEIDPLQSFNFALNMGQLEIPFGTTHVGLVTGFGLEHSRYGFKNNYQLASNSDSTWANIDSTRSFTKNQLRTWTFNVPVLLEFNTSKNHDKNLFINIGVIGGVNFATKTFQKYEVLGGERKDKFKGKYNINPFKLDATARIGYKGVGLFVNYDLLPLFQTNTTELAYPLTFGIRFGG